MPWERQNAQQLLHQSAKYTIDDPTTLATEEEVYDHWESGIEDRDTGTFSSGTFI